MIEIPQYREPENSWEVAFVIGIMKPHWKTGIKKKELLQILSKKRISQLKQWAYWNANHNWCVDHHF